MKMPDNPDEKLKGLISLTNGDEDFIRELLAIFVKNTPEAINRINESLAINDFSSIADTAHKLKSSIQIIGDKELHSLIKVIEEIARSSTNKGLNPKIEKLTIDLEELLMWINNRLMDSKKFT